MAVSTAPGLGGNRVRSLGVTPAGKTLRRTPHGRLHRARPGRQQGALTRGNTCGKYLRMHIAVSTAPGPGGNRVR